MSGPYVPGPNQPLEIVCPRCGRPNTPGVNFCNTCGQSLAGVPARVAGMPAMPGAYPPQQPTQPLYPLQPPAQQIPPYYPQSMPMNAPGYQQPMIPGQAQQVNITMQTPYGPQPYAVLRSPKNLFVAFLLTFFFGPLGMLYSTVAGAITMILVSLGAAILYYALIAGSLDSYQVVNTDDGIAGISFLGCGLSLLLWIVSIIWGVAAAASYNNKLVRGLMR